jgi:hypothetical protein
VIVAFGGVPGRAVVEGRRIFWIELDCLIAVTQSFIGLALVDLGPRNG